MFKCNFCGRETKSEKSNRAHICRCNNNPERVANPRIDYSKRNTSNAFLKARKMGLPDPIHPQKGIIRGIGSGHPHSEEFKKKQSSNAKRRKLGGVRPSLWIRYNGKTLQSSYELQVAQDLDKNNIEWNTCPRFEYVDPLGKKRTYTPDIYLPQFDVYLDPKNDFLIENINPRLGFSDKQKIELAMQQNKIVVLILNRKELSWECIQEKIAGLPEWSIGTVL